MDKAFNDDGKAKLVEGIKEKCGEDMVIEIEIVDAIPLTESGKHRFVVSKISPYLNSDV